MKKTEKPWGKTHLLQIIDVSSCSDDFECIPSKVETTSSVLRQWAIKTRPLSNCVLRASAYQRARQRNIGIAKKSYQGFWRLFGKGRMFGRPFFKTNPEELSTLCIYPKQLLNNTKNVSIKKKRCLSQILPNIFILQLWRNIPLTIMTLIVFCLEIMQWKENASTLILWTWE